MRLMMPDSATPGITSTVDRQHLDFLRSHRVARLATADSVGFDHLGFRQTGQLFADLDQIPTLLFPLAEEFEFFDQLVQR